MNIHLPRTFAAKNIMKRFIIVAMVLLCSGCGRNDGRVAVAGKTALDGTPIAEGMINFFPTGETKGPTAGASIKDGFYSIPAATGPCVGLYRVEIRGLQKTGRQIPLPGPNGPGMMVDEVLEIVPSHYNTKSTLEVELKPGRNQMDFPLSTKENNHN